LEIIRAHAIVGVAVIVRRRHGSSAATRSECNPQEGIVVNRIAKNGPAGVVASKSSDADAVEGIKGDDVAFPCIHPADRPDGRIASDDATISVAQRRAVNVGADFISLDNYPYRSAANKDSIGTRVDHIARARCAATDGGVE
jgi:hypothetical protein